jgi:hypothetical protein
MTQPPPIRSQMRRLAGIAAEINAYLLVVAIGLGALDTAVFAALNLPPLPPAATDEDTVKPEATGTNFVAATAAGSTP